MSKEITNKRCGACGGSGLEDSYHGQFSDPCGSCNGTGMLLVPYEPED